MLPSLEECQNTIQLYKQKSREDRKGKQYDNAWNVFQKYKGCVESEHRSMFDDQHVNDTSKKLTGFLNAFGACRPGRVDPTRLEQNLQRIRPGYERIQAVVLGQGKIDSICESLRNVYDGLSGISTLDVVVENHTSLIVPKSKALMALWGQTPSFDVRVRSRLQGDLPSIGEHTRRYSSEEFCDILRELDQWVNRFEQNYGIQFSSLYPGVPNGRIVDIIYWSDDGLRAKCETKS